MSRCLVLITTAFPFASGEPYLETEIPFLAAAFSRVLIFTIGLHPDRQTALPLPENVTAYNCARFAPKQARALDTLHGASAILSPPDGVLPDDLHEAGRSLLRRAFLGYFCAREKRHAAEIETILEQIDFSEYDEAVVYGYWFFVAAATAVRAGASLRQRGMRRVQVISRAHGYDLYPYANRLNYLPCRSTLLESLDAVYPCSENGAAFLRERYPAYAGKIRPALLGTDGGAPQNGSTDGVFRLLTCARTVPLKRLDRLAQTLCDMRPAHPIEWTHIGDGPQLPALQKTAQHFPAGVTAHFTGELPHAQVLRFYREHPVDLFVLLSTREGLPVSVMEAQSFGVPAIVTDVGGCTELIRDGENGYVLPASFSDALLRSTLERAMRSPQTMRDAAFRTWQTRFTADNYRQFATMLSE